MLASGTVNASTVVLTYTEAGVGMAGATPAAADFAVTKNGATAVGVSNVVVDTVAKTVNFGVIYGISAHGLAIRLGIPRDQGAKFIDAYFKRLDLYFINGTVPASDPNC